MSLRIRLSRGGAKKRPFYRIVVADSRKPRDGRYIERLGTYNPMVEKDHSDRLNINEERIKYWLGVGAQPSDRVARFLSDKGLVDKPVIHDQTKQHLPRAKTLERIKDAEEAAAKAAAAPAEEAPAEEAKAEEKAEDAPAEEAKADEKAEDAPAEEAKADEKAEDAPAEEAKAEEKAEGAPAEDEKPEEKAEEAKEEEKS